MKNKKIQIVFEAGPTHNSFKSAKELIFSAAIAGADAIKFQIIDADEIMADKKIKIKYKIFSGNRLKFKENTIYSLLKKRMLSYSDWKKLKLYSDSLNLDFFATVGSKKDILFLKKIGCKEIKIASGDLNYIQLIEEVAKTGIKIQLDTGGGSLKQIKNVINILKKKFKYKNNDITLHHCPPGYPTILKRVNLNYLNYLKNKFKVNIGFSDHSPGYDISILAMTKSIDVLEKTISLNKNFPSIEHCMALNTYELPNYIDILRDISTGKLKPREIIKKNIFNKIKQINGSIINVQPNKVNISKDIRRSLYLNKNSKKNTKLKDLNYKFKRPGYGIQPDEFIKFKNFRLKKSFKKNYNLRLNDIYK
jgi:N,N'-diacetyllegionaminate synthase